MKNLIRFSKDYVVAPAEDGGLPRPGDAEIREVCTEDVFAIIEREVIGVSKVAERFVALFDYEDPRLREDGSISKRISLLNQPDLALVNMDRLINAEIKYLQLLGKGAVAREALYNIGVSEIADNNLTPLGSLGALFRYELVLLEEPSTRLFLQEGVDNARKQFLSCGLSEESTAGQHPGEMTLTITISAINPDARRMGYREIAEDFFNAFTAIMLPRTSPVLEHEDPVDPTKGGMALQVRGIASSLWCVVIERYQANELRTCYVCGKMLSGSSLGRKKKTCSNPCKMRLSRFRKYRAYALNGMERKEAGRKAGCNCDEAEAYWNSIDGLRYLSDYQSDLTPYDARGN